MKKNANSVTISGAGRLQYITHFALGFGYT